MDNTLSIRRALLSTSNKTGIVEFARALADMGIEIIATGNTARLLLQHTIAVTEVATYTGFPEMMEGRVKTLHPKIFGGLLARRGQDDAVMQQHDIQPIDLIAVNLYPFEHTIQQADCTFANAIEHIDIGGPSLIRAAAKNHEFITTLVDPQDYELILDEIKTQGTTQLATRRQLALKAFTHTATYDAHIAHYLSAHVADNHEHAHAENEISLPQYYLTALQKKTDLRYGENPQQKAAIYWDQNTQPGNLTAAEQLQGKPLSYNNLLDADAALQCVNALDPAIPSCVIVKHATPCGVAAKPSLTDAYLTALATDPKSAFGGIIAVNQALTAQTAKIILKQQFAEVIIAPDVAPAAQSILMQKPNIRVLAVGAIQPHYRQAALRTISGGVLIQATDSLFIDTKAFHVVSNQAPSPQQLADLYFAWRVVTFVKSNAIVYAKDQATLGIGSGQTSRVFSAKIAALKAEEAGLSLAGAVMASDAFLPFADSLLIAKQQGITALIQPGGSIRDSEVINAANEAGIAMVFTGTRHFRH